MRRHDLEGGISAAYLRPIYYSQLVVVLWEGDFC